MKHPLKHVLSQRNQLLVSKEGVTVLIVASDGKSEVSFDVWWLWRDPWWL